MTLWASLLSVVFSFAMSIPMALGRVYGGKWMDRILSVPVDLLRAIPDLVLILWVYYSLPMLIGERLDPLIAGVIALSLRYGATGCEIIRSGLGSVSSGQRLAGQALGLSRIRVTQVIVLPQAFIKMIPPLTSHIVALIKGTSLLFVIAVAELMYQASVLNALIDKPLLTFTLIGIVYFAVTYPITIVSNSVFQRISARSAN